MTPKVVIGRNVLRITRVGVPARAGRLVVPNVISAI